MELHFDRSSNILICKKNSVYNVHSCCTFRLAILLKDRSLDYFAHKFGLGLSTQRFTVTFLVRNHTYEHFFPCVQFLVLNFCTQGFLWGVFLCLKIGSWKEVNRVIFLWMLLFFCPSFPAYFFFWSKVMKSYVFKSSFQEKKSSQIKLTGV